MKTISRLRPPPARPSRAMQCPLPDSTSQRRGEPTPTGRFPTRPQDAPDPRPECRARCVRYGKRFEGGQVDWTITDSLLRRGVPYCWCYEPHALNVEPKLIFVGPEDFHVGNVANKPDLVPLLEFRNR